MKQRVDTIVVEFP
jgi:hypothetical protein